MRFDFEKVWLSMQGSTQYLEPRDAIEYIDAHQSQPISEGPSSKVQKSQLLHQLASSNKVSVERNQKAKSWTIQKFSWSLAVPHIHSS